MGLKDKKSKQTNSSNQQQHQNGGHFSPFKFAKLVDPDASWDKDQLGDVLHWIRQIVALLCGLIWGAIPLIGGIWIVILHGLWFTVWDTFNGLNLINTAASLFPTCSFL
ncbi:uncharacterized protein LOC108219775 isoform X2 [Daucus carota subsp. sativus]|uniref:uncharacterized protein LOC108219775 isoform X2 n=1 Tax=Daucus carota subsp. sativus TaxID=79200 RepID=UPI00308272A2